MEHVLAQSQVGPVFVEGEWGVGKTHLLCYVQASAETLGVPCALINLDAYSSALNYPQRFYTTIAERLTLEGNHGLRAIITSLICDQRTRHLLQAFAGSTESGELSRPLTLLCQGILRGEETFADEQAAWNVMLGLDMNWSTQGYKRRAALARISALAKLFGAVGVGGIVVLFDEAETIDQLWNIRSRLTAYTTIGSICQNEGLWAIFGITERFHRTLAIDLDRLSTDGTSIDEKAHWFLSHWRKGGFNIIKPPPIDKALAPMIVERVADLYREAYQIDLKNLHLDQVLVEWGKNPHRNPRRLIRSVVEKIDRSRQMPLH